MTDVTVNFDRIEEKRQIIAKLGELRGLQRITIVQHRPRRSDAQNRYYWPCFVEPLFRYLHDQGWEGTEDEVHVLMKTKFLRIDVYDPKTGEVLGESMKSSKTLTTVEFNDYLERCAAWLAEMFGIVVPEPSLWREEDERQSARGSVSEAEQAIANW